MIKNRPVQARLLCRRQLVLARGMRHPEEGRAKCCSRDRTTEARFFGTKTAAICCAQRDPQMGALNGNVYTRAYVLFGGAGLATRDAASGQHGMSFQRRFIHWLGNSGMRFLQRTPDSNAR